MIRRLLACLALLAGLAASAALSPLQAQEGDRSCDARADQNWVCPGDYPIMALREEREGTAVFRVRVGIDGLVKECVITMSSGWADLDATTCAVITRRASFKPATDGEGNPIEGYWSNSVRWEIPE